MEDGLAVKINGAEVLEKQLSFRAKKGQHGIIALASATDPYTKAESMYRMTRRFLEQIRQYRFPVLMITKSDGILHDLDLLVEIDRTAIHANDLTGKLGGAILSFSISTFNEKVAAALEPGAPAPHARLETMRKCREAGFLTGVNCRPTLAFISDTDEALEQMIVAAKEYGAHYIFIGSLTLFGNRSQNSRTLYYKFLRRSYPHLIPAYEKLYNGFFMPRKDYIARLEERARRLCALYGIKSKLL